MLQTALSSLGSFFSRSFIVGFVFPALVAVLLNGLFIALATEGIKGSVAYLKTDLAVADVATVLGIAALIATALAFSLAPMIQGFRRALEGDVIFGRLRQEMIRRTAERGARVLAARDAARIFGARVARLQQASIGRFEAAIARSRQGQPAYDEASIKAAEAARASAAAKHEAITAEWGAGDFSPITGKAAEAALTEAVKAVELALASNPPSPAAGAGPADAALAQRLKAVHEEVVALLITARGTARAILSGLESRISTYMISENPQPTRLGNLNAQLQEHCRVVYGAGFDYLWPRIRLIMGNDQDKFEAVEQAQTQLNFALTMLLLVLLTGTGWLVWLGSWHKNAEAILIAGLAMPLLAVFFYRVVLEAQRATIETMKAAIDRHRFQLLDALHVTKPVDYKSEVVTWSTLEKIACGYLRDGDLTYEHPPK